MDVVCGSLLHAIIAKGITHWHVIITHCIVRQIYKRICDLNVIFANSQTVSISYCKSLLEKSSAVKVLLHAKIVLFYKLLNYKC